MMPTYDPYSWTRLRHEEALREAKWRSLAELAKGNRGRKRFEAGRVGCASSGLLSLLR